MPTPRIPFPTTPSEYLVAPTGGWSPDVPTWELAADQAPLLENFQIKPGKLRVRPPYRVTCDLTSAAVSLAGWIPYGKSKSLLTKRLFTSSFPVEPQNVHRVGLNVPPGLTPVEDAYYGISGPTVTKFTFSAGHVGFAPGWRQTNFNGNKYALTYAAPGGAVLPYNNGVTGWASNVLFLDTTNPPATDSGAPVGGFDIYGWLDRVFVLGGQDPATVGSAKASTTAFFYTNPIDSLTGSASDWKDPHSGLYNVTDIDGDHTDAGVAMASVPAGLLFLRQNSLFILRGTDPTTYVLRPISKQAGCLDARSVVEINSKVYFMSEQGFMVTDGTQVQNVSGALQDELYRQIAVWNTAVYTSTGAWCTADPMTDGKILVSFGVYSTGNVSINYPMIGQFSAVFDPATGAWVKVTTLITPTSSTNLGPSIQAYEQFMTLGNTQVVTIEDSTLGNTTTGLSSLHDVLAAGGGFTPITAIWIARSPQANLASRGRVHIKRAFLDYAISTGGATGNVSLELIDRQKFGTPSVLLVATVAASTNASDPRQYLERDNFSEVADLGINVVVQGSGTTGPAAANKAEIHGIGVEFSATRDMRPTV